MPDPVLVARVLRGETVRLPDDTECPLADGRALRVGETWRYNGGPPHTLWSVALDVPFNGTDQYVPSVNEPRPTFVTHPKGYGHLHFDAVTSGDPAKWESVKGPGAIGDGS